MAAGRAAVLAAVLALAGAQVARADDGPNASRTPTTLAEALPADGRTDVVLIDLPAVAGAPRVRAATRVNAPPAAVRAVLLDPAHFRALIPSLVRSEVQRDAPGTQADRAGRTVDWELEVPLFNLSGRFALRALPDGARFDLFEGTSRRATCCSRSRRGRADPRSSRSMGRWTCGGRAGCSAAP